MDSQLVSVKGFAIILFHIVAAGICVKGTAIEKISRQFATFPFRRKDERLQQAKRRDIALFLFIYLLFLFFLFVFWQPWVLKKEIDLFENFPLLSLPCSLPPGPSFIGRLFCSERCLPLVKHTLPSPPGQTCRARGCRASSVLNSNVPGTGLVLWDRGVFSAVLPWRLMQYFQGVHGGNWLGKKGDVSARTQRCSVMPASRTRPGPHAAVTLTDPSAHRSFMLSFAFDKTLVVLRRCGCPHMRNDFRFFSGPFRCISPPLFDEEEQGSESLKRAKSVFQSPGSLS